MKSNGFQFKQFYVRHDRCAMKVGTDGVLLGAWAGAKYVTDSSATGNGGMRVLDIGTGSGLIALMVAQRYPEARIEAIDIDPTAVAQAAENFASSPWAERMQAWCCPLQKWLPEAQYQLIVSNPPYFHKSLKNPDLGRKQARHTDSLSYEELIHYAAQMLAPNGCLAIILPAEAEQDMRLLGIDNGLALTRVTRVYSKESKPVRRVLMEWTKNALLGAKIRMDNLVLEDETGNRSDAYKEWTKAYYL